jgi:hypothetical protein
MGINFDKVLLNPILCGMLPAPTHSATYPTNFSGKNWVEKIYGQTLDVTNWDKTTY